MVISSLVILALWCQVDEVSDEIIPLPLIV
jgi:hypothetical protein